MKNREFKTLLAVVTLTGTLLLGLTAGAVPVYAQDVSAKPYKSETVYAVIDNDGTIKDVTVSDQLKNISDISKVKDKSGLTQIENVKGDEKFTSRDGNLVWNTEDADICYQGTTKKELPVSVKVTYLLDGKEVTADELKGKSGHLVIRYTYENHTGEEGTTVPFLMVTGLVLNDTMCKNVSVTNGHLISDGEREMVVGFGIPKLREMLGIDTDLFPDSFEAEADVTDYEPVESMTIATNRLFNDLETDEFESLKDLQSSMDQLQSASMQLVEGSGELRAGLDTLLSSSGTLTGGINQLADGSISLADGTRTLKGGAAELAGGLNIAAAKVSGELLSGVRALNDGVTQMQGSLSAGLPELSNGVNSLTGGISQAADGTAALNQGLSQVKTGVDSLSTNIQRLSVLLKNVSGSQAANADIISQMSALSADASNLADELYTAAFQAEQTNAASNRTDTGINNNDEIAALQNLADKATDEATRDGIYEVIDSLSNDQALRDSAADSAVAANNSELAYTLTALAQKAETLSEKAAAVTEYAGAASAPSLDEVIKMIDSQLVPGVERLEKAISGDGTVLGLASAANQLDQALNVGNAEAGIPSLRTGADALNQKVNGKGGLTEQVTGGVSRLKEGMSKLVQGVDGENGLAAGMQALNGGASKLVDGSSSLNAGADTLASGIGALQMGSTSLIDGVQQLNDGAARLNEGMIQFDEDGIQKLTEAFGGDVERLLDTVNSLLKASRDYKNFSGIADDMDGEVKFVFVTK